MKPPNSSRQSNTPAASGQDLGRSTPSAETGKLALAGLGVGIRT